MLHIEKILSNKHKPYKSRQTISLNELLQYFIAMKKGLGRLIENKNHLIKVEEWEI